MIKKLFTWADLRAYRVTRILVSDAASPLSGLPEKRIEVYAANSGFPDVRMVMRYQYWPNGMALTYFSNSLEREPLLLISPQMIKGMRDTYDIKISSILRLLSWSKEKSMIKN